MKKCKSLEYLLFCIFSLLAVFLGIFLIEKSNYEHKLDNIQQDAIAELENNKGQYADNKIILYNTNPTEAKKFAEMLNAKLRIVDGGNFATLTLPDNVSIDDVYKNKEYRDYIDKFSIDYRAKITDIDLDTEDEETIKNETSRPDYAVEDSYYSYQNYLDYLNVSNVWDNYKGDGVKVAIIDTGIDTDHPEFNGKISEWSYNASTDKIVKDYDDWSLIEDEQGHGTAVAGVIAASMDQQGIVGIAPNVELVVIKCECDDEGRFYNSSDLIFGLYYAIEQNVDVVNMSFDGGGDFSLPAKLAVDSNIICVAATGNKGRPETDSPACLDNVIGVGALADNSWELASYSNYGEGLDIVAPGTVFTTKIGGTYGVMHGTSFSTPIVSASIALIKQQTKWIGFKQVKELLQASSYDLGDLGYDYIYGYGALDISALILEERCTVTFDYLTDEIKQTKQTFIKGHALQCIPEPDRNYSIFDGWYYDVYCEEELEWYSDIWNEDLTLYASWCNEDDGVPYTYVTLEDNTVEIRSYTGHRRYITIPDYIDGKVVSSIGINAFSQQTRLRQINLPKHLKIIRNSAFFGCSNLLNISIPESVECIEDYAFSNNVRLSYIYWIGDSQITSVGRNAFSNTSLKEFTVPAKLNQLDGSAFFGTTKMQKYIVANGNASFAASNGVLYNSLVNKIVAYPAGISRPYYIPDSIDKIGVCAFAYTRLSSIDFNNVSVIEGSAFQFSSLEHLNIKDTIKSVGSRSFYGCFYLKDVIIGKGLTEISSEAFSNCFMLNEITIPNNIETISGRAFFSSGLQNLSFEHDSRLIEIGSYAFARTQLFDIALPKSLIVIGDSAFIECFYLSSVSFEQGSVLKTIGSGTFANDYLLSSISFPYELAIIGDYAFSRCISLETIVFPNSLQYVGSYAFIDSGLMGNIHIPENLTNMGANPFASCHSLESFTVSENNKTYQSIDGVLYSKEGATYSFNGSNITPNNYAIISYPAGKKEGYYAVVSNTNIVEDSAFYGAFNLNTLYLNTELEEIHRYAFYDCKNLTGIDTIPDNVTQISNYAFAHTDKLLVINFNDSSKLQRISINTFAFSGIINFRVPRNVSSIAQYAFSGCDNLRSITFARGSKLEYISAYNFIGCEDLESIIFENGSTLTDIQAHAFEGMSNLKVVDFGDAHITNIDNYAFRYCYQLESIIIPEGVRFIGRFAFYSDYSLNQVIIPSTVEYIGCYAFYTKDRNINLFFNSLTLPNYVQENWDEGIKGYYLDNADILTTDDYDYSISSKGDISIIKYHGTDKDIDLAALDLGGDIVSIGGYAFYRSNIKSIVLPETLSNIGRYAFANSRLESVIIPDNVSFIGRYAFYDCSSLELVTISETSKLTKIEKYAFANTYSLHRIYIPKNIDYLGSSIFYKSGLSEIVFDGYINLKEIPENAFEGSKLSSVTIPDSVTLINHNAFRDVLTLSSVNWGNGDDFQLMSNVFYNTGLTGDLFIPSNLIYIGEYSLVGLNNLNNYIVDENNPRYKSVDGVLYSKDGKKLINFPAMRSGSFVVPNNVETIGFGAFENTSLSEVSFEDGINLLTIGYRAFFNSDSLTIITIPDSVVSIDYYAFAYCDNLETVIFNSNNNLTGIYEGAFYLDKSLKNIIIPDSVIEVSDYAFYGCQSLDSLPLSINSQLKGIYDYAFAYSGIKGELVIPDKVDDLGEYSFIGTMITSVIIPDINKETLNIGIGVFEKCNYLESIVLPFTGDEYMSNDNIVWFSYIFGARRIEDSIEFVPSSLKIVTVTGEVSAGLKSSDIFSQDMSISNLTLPYGVNRITGTFKGWTNLTSITIPDSVTSIGDGAFFRCSSLPSIIIPNSVTSIGSNAFYRCSSLTSITIPDSITSIGDSAFQYCSSLTSITIPDSITSIGFNVFGYCYSLKLISLPDSITSIGRYAFGYCSSLKTISLPDSITSIGEYAFTNCSSLTSITLPNNIYKIDDYAFASCSSLRYVTVPSNIISIDDAAFWYCTSLEIVYNNSNLDLQLGSSGNGYVAYYAKVLFDKDGNKTFIDGYDNFEYIDTVDGFRFLHNGDEYVLVQYLGNEDTVTLPSSINSHDYKCEKMKGFKNVIIPEGIRGIDDYMFDGCSSLTSITIPDSVTSIGFSAFSNCSSLVAITIPDSVTSIGDVAFSRCSSLTSITIPDSVASIGDVAFSDCSSLTSITIPDSVTSIGYGAFSNCSSLLSITIPDSVTSIGSYAFSGCSSLTSITIPDSVCYLGTDVFKNNNQNQTISISPNNPNYLSIDGVIYNKEKTEIIYVSNSVSSLFVPNCVTTFSLNAFIKEIRFEEGSNISKFSIQNFLDCSSLESIIIPNSITTIPYGLFQNCSSLTSITIPNSVTSIGYWAFHGCSSLESITIPDSVTSIDSNAFDNCSSLTSITIPNSVTSIGDGVFSNCSSLTSITIPNSVTSIGDRAFHGCSSLESITIPDSVTSIVDLAFYGCSSLASITIPDSVTSIGSSAFYGCSSLVSITIPDSVTSIGSSAFSNCSSLASITIPNSVTSIGSYAFSRCSSLTSITIPESVTSIENYAFSNCGSLYFIQNNSHLDISLGSDNNGYIAYNAKVLFDKDGNKTFIDGYDNFEYIDTVDGFRFLHNGDEYVLVQYLGNENTVTLPCSINGHDYKCERMKGFKNVIIPEGISGIDDYMFNGCSSLASITIPDSVTSIGDSAFFNCSSLTSITISNSVTSIGSYAFYCCSSLTSIIIPDSVTSIGDSAFQSCSSLETVYFGNNLKNIGKKLLLNTKLYNDENNWINGCLIINNYLIDVKPDITDIEITQKCVAKNIFAKCTSLKTISLQSDVYFDLEDFPYLSTLIVNNSTMLYESGICRYLYSSLDSIVIENCNISRPSLPAIGNNFRLFIDEYEEDVNWDEDFPGWKGNRKVYYKGEWIKADFYDADDKLISQSYISTFEVIKQPYISPIVGDEYSTIFIGWDLNGDYLVDPIPATSHLDISARAIMDTVRNVYKINVYGFNNELISSTAYHYKELIIVPDEISKEGYIFLGWTNYYNGMLVESDLDIYSSWSHIGGDHSFTTISVLPTCTNDGYDLHTCLVCGYQYSDNIIPAKGHEFGEWVTEIEPTCVLSGTKYHECEECHIREYEDIDHLGHVCESSISKDATCETEGEIIHNCENCDYEFIEIVQKTEHHYHKVHIDETLLNWLNIELPNMFYSHEDGNYYCYICEDCGHYRTASSPVSVSSISTKNINCDHVPGDWIIALEPICVKEGVVGRYCLLCDELVEAKSIPVSTIHTPEEAVQENIIPATCTEPGSYDLVTYCADCHEELERIHIIDDALGHDLIHHERVEPTCTEHGHEAYDTCTRCDYSTYAEIEPLGHTPGEKVHENIVNPTCTLDRSHDEVTYCTVCHEELERFHVVDEALGHDLIHHDRVEPTCTEHGHEAYDTCSRCDYSTYTEIEPLGHDYNFSYMDWAKDMLSAKAVFICSHDSSHIVRYDADVFSSIAKQPTCTDKGTTSYVASYLGYIDCVDLDDIPVLGHNPGEIVHENVINPTCTLDGGHDEVTYCTVCHEELSRIHKDIDALGHTWGDWSVTKEPTCTEPGCEHRICTVCGHEEERIIEALGHNYSNEWTIDIPATCTHEGSKSHHCSRCDSKSDITAIPMLDHVPEEAVQENIIPATCTEPGSYDLVTYCADCHEELSRIHKDIDALGHTWGDWSVTKEPTCTEPGCEHRICTVCGHEEERIIPKIDVIPLLGECLESIDLDNNSLEDSFAKIKQAIEYYQLIEDKESVADLYSKIESVVNKYNTIVSEMNINHEKTTNIILEIVLGITAATNLLAASLVLLRKKVFKL